MLSDWNYLAHYRLYNSPCSFIALTLPPREKPLLDVLYDNAKNWTA